MRDTYDTPTPFRAELTLLLANFTVQVDLIESVLDRRCDPVDPPNFTLPRVPENWQRFKPILQYDHDAERKLRRDIVTTFGISFGGTLVAGAVFIILTM